MTKSHQQILNAQRHLEVVFASAIDAMIVTNAQGIIRLFNEAAEQMFGYRSEEVLGLSVSILMPISDGLNHHLYMERYVQTRKSRIPRQGREVIAKRRNGENFFADITISDVILKDEIIFTAVIRDITTRKNREQRIIQLAFFDQETSLPNAYYLYEKLDDILKEQQTNYYLISLYLGDLTDYINIFGIHSVKDIISTLVKLLNDKLPDQSIVTRCGQRDLKIIYKNSNKNLSIEQIARELQGYLSLPLTIAEHHIFLTAKFGLIEIKSQKHTVKTVLDHADIALHMAKYHITNDYEIFKDEFEKTLHRRALIVQKLYKAMDNPPFQLYLQPQISLKQEKIIGVEALIRWQDDNGEWVSPAEFIPIAETIGLIKDITLWTLKQTCIIVEDWKKSHGQHCRISINISAQILCSDSFVKEIRYLIDEIGIIPTNLELEITETALMMSIDTAVATIQELSDLGVSISIDDFGTGLSSLSYLKLFKINRLKIDKSFIDDILNNERDLEMVKAIIQLGHDLGYQVVCEGIENKQQFELLKELGCDEVQGYYFARPMSAELFLELLNNFKFQ